MTIESQTSNSFLYGKGVFTTIRIIEGNPFLFEKHWRRLVANANLLKVEFSISEDLLREKVENTIRDEQEALSKIRITVVDNSESIIWSIEDKRSSAISIVSGVLRQINEQLQITFSPHRTNSTSPLAGIKSCNYLENLLAVDEAKSRGYDEAIRLNERGEVVGGCMSNVFWLAGERLFTPDLSTGCLAGTTREFILENLECSEVNEGFEVLKKANAIFLTSAGIGVKNVMMLDEISLNNIEHPILKLLPG